LHAAGREVLGVEIEIAFRIGRDLVARADPYADEEVFAAIDAAVVAIELCATRLADWQHAGALWRLADFQSHGALVLGSTLARWRGLDFGAQVAQLRVNGSLRAETRGSHPLRDPSQLLPWMARHVCSRGGDLRHGDIVTTGSWTGLQPVAAGDRIEARFPGIGAAALVLAT